MLESIIIKGFRKYDDFKLDGFGKINFVLGDNNIGKTSILESIFAWACGQNVIPFLNIPVARGRYAGIQHPYWIMEEIMATVNDRKTVPMEMTFDGKYNGKNECFVHTIYPSELLSEYDTSYKNSSNLISVWNNGTFSTDAHQVPQGISSLFQLQQATIAKWDICHNNESVSTNITLPIPTVSKVKSFRQAIYIDILSHISVVENVKIYGSLKRENLLDEVTKEINKVFPEIIGFDLIPYPDGSQSPVSVIKDSGVLPMYACGDGIQRWFYILGSLSLYKKSIICIDEIDAGFHHSAQKDFSENLVKNALKNDVQLFITTHNIEYMDSFLEACSNSEEIEKDQIKIITMREVANELKVRTLSSEEAYESRNNFNLELR